MNMKNKTQLISDLTNDYGSILDNNQMSIKEVGGKRNDYVTKKEVLVLSNFPLGTKQNEYGISKNSVRATISNCIYAITDGYKEEMTYREGEMFMNVDTVALIDHKNGYVELMLFSEKLEYSVSLLVRSKGNNINVGSITG